MLPTWSVLLPGLAATLGAAAIGRARGLTSGAALRAAAAAGIPVAGCLVAAVLLVVLSARPAAARGWLDAASLCLLAAPIAAGVVLRFRVQGSLGGAVAAGELAAVMVAAWLTLHLRGPRGGWEPLDAVTVTAGAWLCLTASACAGGWLLRRRRTPGPAA